MMKYTFSMPVPFERFVQVQLEFNGIGHNKDLELVLPSWRPGRYELGNFARNIRGFQVIDQDGSALSFNKTARDRWKINSGAASRLIVKYQYYAAQPDAGACFVNHEQLYINPVHCCMFVSGREHEPCEVVLNVPADWHVATGLKLTQPHVLQADNFDRLIDSPFIASPDLQHAYYKVNNIDFHIWIQGECTSDWSRIIPDFEAFTVKQLEMMGSFPAKDFHFLIQVLPYRFYHGVEHLNSTVLALGPGNELMQDALYKELLGVASHELFHCWNVKTIRPLEMMPYDVTRENYATTGYVYEGVTTYYGDLILGRSGFFNLKQMLAEFASRFQRHMDNPGRFNYSVAESSFDTWLDGYVPGIPGRKVSIYDEGCLIALLLDFMIRSSTDSTFSLDDVMRMMNEEFGKISVGYSSDDFISICEKVGNRNFRGFFEEVVYRPCSLHAMVEEALSLAGIAINVKSSENAFERLLGLRMNGSSVLSVYPGSPAAEAGIVKDDEIVAVNGNKTDSSMLVASENTIVDITLISFGKTLEKRLAVTDSEFYSRYTFEPVNELTGPQERFRSAWLGR